MAVTTVQIKVKSITLSRDDVVELCGIVDKVGENEERVYRTYELESETGSVQVESCGEFRTTVWPRNPHSLRLWAHSPSSGRIINLDLKRQYSHIRISGENKDWVSARRQEIGDFIEDHRNTH